MDTTHVTSPKQARNLLYALERDVKDLADESEGASPARRREIEAELVLVERHVNRLLDLLYGGTDE